MEFLPTLKCKRLRHYANSQWSTFSGSFSHQRCSTWSSTTPHPWLWLDINIREGLQMKCMHIMQELWCNPLYVGKELYIYIYIHFLFFCCYDSPAVTNTMSAPWTTCARSTALSSAAFLPTEGLPPAPKPRVTSYHERVIFYIRGRVLQVE